LLKIFYFQSIFTRNPAELIGQIINVRIQKGSKGLGLSLIGQDGTHIRDEFIQVNFLNILSNFIFLLVPKNKEELCSFEFYSNRVFLQL